MSMPIAEWEAEARRAPGLGGSTARAWSPVPETGLGCAGQQLQGCDAKSGGKKELGDGALNLVLKGGGS